MKQQQQVKPLHSIHVQFPRNKSVDPLTRSWKRKAGTWITTQSKVATPVSGDTHALSKSSKLNKPWSISIHDFFDALEFQNWIPRYCGEKVFIDGCTISRMQIMETVSRSWLTRGLDIGGSRQCWCLLRTRGWMGWVFELGSHTCSYWRPGRSIYGEGLQLISNRRKEFPLRIES